MGDAIAQVISVEHGLHRCEKKLVHPERCSSPKLFYFRRDVRLFRDQYVKAGDFAVFDIPEPGAQSLYVTAAVVKMNSAGLQARAFNSGNNFRHLRRITTREYVAVNPKIGRPRLVFHDRVDQRNAVVC